MFKAEVFGYNSRRVLNTGHGKTATAAITAARINIQVNDTVGVRVYENQCEIFTAYNYGVMAAIKTAHAMNRKNRDCSGR